MPIEVEKKYRLTDAQRDLIVRRLAEIGAKNEGQVFEENLLFDGAALKGRNCVLRLRRVAGKAILTFKERLPGKSATKRQREEETPVQDGDTMQTILADLGYRPRVVYEKKRETWRLEAAEMEIEGSEAEIENTENALAIAGLTAETATYPQLAAISGTLQGSIIEARFTKENRRD